ncbi:uncharacterized protein LOC131018517 [Salvia miltiorrhiza]|uniref:uncharacterized protein LOC131018517 n=1 Tax=Salvia miltiorrhiza TaxID=226208 RepID=UPI0025AC9242|nr:uncharacterized protein LOC131018517 [Salvia miltiorrhiza]
MEKYFPRSYHNQKQAEFLELKQGEMSVIEYERRFNRLARYTARLVDTDDQKADSVQEIVSYGVAVRRAHEVEAGLEIDNNTRQTNYLVKRKWDNKNKWNKNAPNGKGRYNPYQAPTTSTQKPMCPQCKRPHFGKCYGPPGVCYICQDPGHYANNCPRRGRNNPKQGGEARLYAFTRQEAGEGSGTMSGMISISELPVLALFDSSASHSFISAELCEKTNVLVEVENLALDVRLPSGETLRTDRMARNVELILGGKGLVADCHVLEMHEFDLILGMDWLSSNYATIRCHQREVVFQRPEE